MKKLFIYSLLFMFLLSFVAADCVDNDQDGYCAGIDDCNDNNSDSWMAQGCFRDSDGDGYNFEYGYACLGGVGEFCYCGDGTMHDVCSTDFIPYTDMRPLGLDCDDSDKTIHNDCVDNPIGVPEFGLIAGLAVVGLAGLFVYKKRR